MSQIPGPTKVVRFGAFDPNVHRGLTVTEFTVYGRARRWPAQYVQNSLLRRPAV